MNSYINIDTLGYYGLYAMLITMALMTIGADHPVIALFCLVIVFMDVGAIYIHMGVEYLAFSYIIVYVGAIAILFLFVIMMLNIKLNLLIENNIRYLPMGSILGFILFIELSAMIDYKYIILLLFTPIKMLLYYLNIIPFCYTISNNLSLMGFFDGWDLLKYWGVPMATMTAQGSLHIFIDESFIIPCEILSPKGYFYNILFSMNSNEIINNDLVNNINNISESVNNSNNNSITPEIIKSLNPMFSYGTRPILTCCTAENAMVNIDNFNMENYKALISPGRVDIIIDHLGNIVSSYPVRDTAGNLVAAQHITDTSDNTSIYYPLMDKNDKFVLFQVIKDLAGNTITIQQFTNSIGNVIGVETIFDNLGNIISILPQLNTEIKQLTDSEINELVNILFFRGNHIVYTADHIAALYGSESGILNYDTSNRYPLPMEEINYYKWRALRTLPEHIRLQLLYQDLELNAKNLEAYYDQQWIDVVKTSTLILILTSQSIALFFYLIGATWVQ